MIAWFAKNSVASNLMMWTIVFLGFFSIFNKLTFEVFPTTESDTVVVSVVYRGATPHEVEKGVLIRMEEAIQDLEGIKEIRAIAEEGVAKMNVEIENGYEPRDILDEIKNRVDAINTFPDHIERPKYKIAENRREVISVIVQASLDEAELRREAERIREELLSISGVTQIELSGVRKHEMAIEISESTLQKYGLTLEKVADAIRHSSLDIPAGHIKTKSGEILLRTVNQAYVKKDFEEISLLTTPEGVNLRLGDIVKVIDGFEEEQIICRYNGEKAAILDVYRVGDQNVLEISSGVKKYIEEYNKPNVKLSFWRDRAKLINGRLETLISSALQGGLLVFCMLALFLRLKIAFWVCVGIPVSFLGTLALLPYYDVTINSISLFAFILVLGMVVDDAIVTGENIYTHFKRTKNGEESAIIGTQEVAIPVTFGVLTTVVAFIPLFFIEGRMAPMFNQIPYVVITVLLISLFESKFILPAHLKSMKPLDDNKSDFITRMQQKIAASLERFIDKFYQPLLELALHWRYLTMSLFVGVTVILVTMAFSGRVGWTPFPRIDHEVITVSLKMPLGTNFEVTDAYTKKIEEAAYQLRDKYMDKNGKSLISGILYYGGTDSQSNKGFSHLGTVLMQIIPPEERTQKVSVSELSMEWRKLIGNLPGEARLSVKFEIRQSSNPVDIRLIGNNFEELNNVGKEVKDYLRSYEGLFDINDTYEDGKEELKLKIKPEAEILGLTTEELGRQVRQAYFGEEAQRIQRDKDDIRVMVRYPENERRSLVNIESMKIKLKNGSEVPFSEVAEISMGRGFSKITRVDRRRTINVTADMDKSRVNMADLSRELKQKINEILQNHPHVVYSFDGELKEAEETTSSLQSGLYFTFFAIYALLAIPFRSYLQPLIVMSVIPFGLAGAIVGHIIMGMNLSMLSLFGMLALAGIVVNDSLVMVDYVNTHRAQGMSLSKAVLTAGAARFRPIFLTSITTFAGLMPLILEKSTQAQFLIPMAVSLGFGVMYATLVTLFLIPGNYLILEDILKLFRAKNKEEIL